jgi:RNA polymerase-associated protein RTF1
MADLDAELLALAGGDSSGDESLPSSPKPKSPSPPRSKKQSRESPPVEMGRKGVAKITKRSKRRKTYSDDEDEV